MIVDLQSASGTSEYESTVINARTGVNFA